MISNLNIKYRLADENDLSLLLKLMSEFYIVDHLPYDADAITKGLKKLFSNSSHGQFWLIYDDIKPIGYIIITFGFSLEFHGVDALVDEFFIREDYRGKGIGKQTLKFIEDKLEKLGIKAFHLEVDRQNLYAQEVYRKFGFVDHDRYLMTKWIKKIE